MIQKANRKKRATDDFYFIPNKQEIEQLIETAERTENGVDFLMKGALESVAIGFQSHVFTVEAARKYLIENRPLLKKRTRKIGSAKSRELASQIKVCECWARDGLQSIPLFIPTEHKIEMINRIVDSGVSKLEVTSFSHPKLLPQFSDCVEVLRGIKRKKSVSYVILMPNLKGFERFSVCQEEGYGADEIILMISSSEKHNLLNFRASHNDAMKEHAEIMRRAHSLGVKVIGCAGTVYGCPVGGDISTKEVEKIVQFYLDEGAQTIMLGDTTGMANPVLVRRRIGELISRFPNAKFIAHFHDTRGTGIVNSVAAVELGVTYVDSSIGAIGGQPATGAAKYSLGNTGNTCSEDLVGVLHEMGMDTGIDLEKIINVGRRAEEIVGQRLRSNIIQAGPVIHGPSKPNKGPGEAARGVPVLETLNGELAIRN